MSDTMRMAAVADASKAEDGAVAKEECAGEDEDVDGGGEGGAEEGESAKEEDAQRKEGEAGSAGRVRRPKVGDEVEFAIFSHPSLRILQAVDIKVGLGVGFYGFVVWVLFSYRTCIDLPVWHKLFICPTCC